MNDAMAYRHNSKYIAKTICWDERTWSCEGYSLSINPAMLLNNEVNLRHGVISAEVFAPQKQDRSRSGLWREKRTKNKVQLKRTIVWNWIRYTYCTQNARIVVPESSLSRSNL